MSASAKQKLKELMKRPLSELDPGEIDRMLVGLAEMGRREGLSALEEMTGDAKEPFLATGLRLAVDGTDPELIQAILDIWTESLLREQEVRYRKTLEGIVSVRHGDNPRIVELKLKSLY